jgi:hypothetical protein
MLSEVLSFILAASWVSMSTVVTERLGTKVGAVVTTLPSTLVVALFFMAVEEGPRLAADAALVVPAEMGINVVFLAVFVAASSRGLPTAIGAAMGVWVILSAGLFLLEPRDLSLSLVLFACPVLFTTIWLRAHHRFDQQAGRHIVYTPGEIAFRGLFAGAMIAVSVAAASLSGPVLGGILSVFPAIFTSTMVILYLRQGREFSGAAGTLMILGSANVVVYSIVVAYAFPPLGAVVGTLVALVLSYAWSFGLYLAVRRFVS